MKVLVINAGSSSLKYQLIDMQDESVLAKGNCDRIGIGGHIKHTNAQGKVIDVDANFPTHTEAFEKLIEVLTTGEAKAIDDLSEISAIGHRIVQGADKFSESVIVDESVIKTIEDISDLAPLHNPAHALALRACVKVFGENVPEVVVFDTAFHSTMPQYAFMFGVPYEYYEKYHVRKYGFHGTSHRFVSSRLAELMEKDIRDLKIITCHLGNGSSITAIKGGKVIDTTMGLSPLGGFIMGTRSGSIDPTVVTFIQEKEGLSPKETSDLLNKKSGYLGISGFTSDHRDLTSAAKEGNKRAQLAIEMQRYQVKKYIGSYIAALGGLDALVFTGGIGENSAELREWLCTDMEYLGIAIDNEINSKFNSKEKELTKPGAKVRTFIIPTNEELLIARDTLALVTK